MHETLKLKDLSFEAVCAVIAQVVHAANRQYVETIGGTPVNPTWEGLPERRKQGLMKAIRTTVMTPKTLEESHAAWCEDFKAQGYTRGNRIDHIRKTHPSLVPFRELPFEEQLKDALFLGITSIFASALGLGEPLEATRLEELQLAGEGADELIDEIDEPTDSPVEVDTTGFPETVGEAAEAAQEKLDNIPEGLSPKGAKERQGAANTSDGVIQETFEKGKEKEPELPLPFTQESYDIILGNNDVDLINAHHTKLAVALEDNNNGVKEPIQAPEPKPNLPDEDLAPVEPAKAKTAKKKK